jgi:signal transduction histidine kinase
MRHLWSRSLAAQFICYMLLALAVSQGIGFLISWDERGQALRAAAKGEFFSRTASLARLLETTPSGIHYDILRASGTNYSRFWLSHDEPYSAVAWQHEARAQLAEPLPNLKDSPVNRPTNPGGNTSPAAVSAVSGIAAMASTAPPEWTDIPSTAWSLSRPAKFAYIDDPKGMGLTVRLDSGAWLNAAYSKPVVNSMFTSQSAISLIITATILSVISIFVARGVARPMRSLAVAAEALGRGETIAPVPEIGPNDIRQTAEAFNRMQARLHRFVQDRTRMLAAIGHDLRTPLTSLRLRAEFVSDIELQDKMLRTIDEIEAMTEAALAFARDEAAYERTTTVDLAALAQSLCDDLADLGQDVTFVEGPAINYRCRPDALRRAIRNLIENAVRYGDRARVSLAWGPDTIQIHVEDDGPGIPEDLIEQVFSPFFRLEHSRNRETGGVGLGLSIARATVRHHGGDISLQNQLTGLRASISLPPRE